MKSFAEVHPELLSEWSKKNNLMPDKISYGSNQKVQWDGKCGHSWVSTIKNRGNGSGCPYCSSRKLLPGFNDLRTKFPAIADEWSEKNNPFKPEDFMSKSNQSVYWECRSCHQIWLARIGDRTSGHGCPVCTGEKLVRGINDLETVYPDVISEWSDKNNKKPSDVFPKSRELVWWTCKTCRYEYQAVIDSKVKGLKCPACSGMVVNPGFNDLMTKHPKIAQDWDYNQNGEDLPEHTIATSMKYVFWKGPCGHCWRAKISDRVNGQGCPVCDGIKKRRSRMGTILAIAQEFGNMVVLGSDEIIGIPLDIYLPEKKTTVQLSKKYQGNELRYENAKNWLCYNAGIKMIRITEPDGTVFDNCYNIPLPDDSEETFQSIIESIFDGIRKSLG